MMAVNVKQLSDAQHAWLDDEGNAINIDRAWKKSDKVMAERRLEQGLLAAARKDVPGERRWFALRTLGVGEIELCSQLIDSGVDAVVPVKKVQVKRRFQPRSCRTIHRPVLRGLVFVNLVSSTEAFAGLLRVKGVAAFVGKEGRPHPIGEHEMRKFMDLAQEGAFDERYAPTGLVVGEKVKIGVGPFVAFEGILTGYGKGRTARVMTWLFGREHLVEVKLANLEKLG
ncbi:transcription termination/antitermination protein NusG [Aquamicrobium zhengzhouense]|uniref:NusG-like N-terminal domain-containing protein n=1 Tax=Aquamicrobium zhengzhouense TaxID=2781738 RepID=A0ABS0SA42_9HYPH|nr:transcription termination/antitermination NusG family protein [Aquamicrobium zhengzhouense]MBI1620144.1 hypothetical protein [Aquamicrobium zhengzhouense]